MCMRDVVQMARMQRSVAPAHAVTECSSPEECLVRDQEAPGSIPGTPTKSNFCPAHGGTPKNYTAPAS